MNKSILEDGGEILVISQFTLHASTKKGITEIIIGKQRNGPTCTVELKWLNQYTKFANLEYHDE